jgi:Uncharacterized protein conserved in bacteria (DUF2066)
MAHGTLSGRGPAPAGAGSVRCGPRGAWRRLAIGICLIVLAIGMSVRQLAAQPARGEAPAFTVRNVTVDRTAASAAAAREAALVDGQRSAFRRLLERLVPRSEYRRFPGLSDSRLSDLVQNFEVQNERTSAVRYIATLTYRFRPDDVRTLLRNANLPFAETLAKPHLVLPVLRQQGTALLWDDPNPWRAAWARLAPFDGLAPLVLPKGDLADTAQLSADQALNGDDATLTALARRYGVAGIYVVDAALDASDGGRSTLQVSLSGYGDATGEQTTVESYAANPGEGDDALLLRAATGVAHGIEERWKSEQLLQFGRDAKLTVLIRYDDISQWAAIRRRLADLAMIRRTDVLTLSRRQAVVDLVYIGDDNQLRQALAQRDLQLAPLAAAPAEQGSGDAAPSWQLRLTAAAAAGGGGAARP